MPDHRRVEAAAGLVQGEPVGTGEDLERVVRERGPAEGDLQRLPKAVVVEGPRHSHLELHTPRRGSGVE